MIFDASRRLKRRMEAAQGFLMLDLADQALRELDEIDDAGEQAFHFHLLRGEALRAKSEHRRALDQFLQAHAIDPTDLSALMGMAWCYKRIDRLATKVGEHDQFRATWLRVEPRDRSIKHRVRRARSDAQ